MGEIFETQFLQMADTNTDEFAIGCVLQIKTTLGEDFEAQVITFDRSSNILVLHILLFLITKF